jgi:hypothetical protein
MRIKIEGGADLGGDILDGDLLAKEFIIVIPKMIHGRDLLSFCESINN